MEEQSFAWSNLYRTIIFALFLIPFIDIFVQLYVGNWTWFAVSVAVSLVLSTMLGFSYVRPAIRLADGELRFYLTPITPMVFQSFKVSEVSSVSVAKNRLEITLTDGRKARSNLFAVDPTDRKRLLEYLRDALGLSYGGDNGSFS